MTLLGKVSAFGRRSLLLTAVFGIVCLAWLSTSYRAAVPFTGGNIVIYRVGDGASGLVNSGNPIFLDEYTPAGALVQSIPLPLTTNGANRRIIASGTATSEGLLTRSSDGQFLLVTGYDAVIPTASLAGTSASTNPRVVGRIDANGVVDTTTALTDLASGNNPRGVASSNGTDLWVTGASGGVRYTTLGGTTSTQLSTTVTNIRAAQIFDGQLYISDSSGSAVRIGNVGAGLPTTSGQIITSLPGFPASTGSPYGFYLADLSVSVPGLDTLYVADDGLGLTKYSLVSGSWTANGTIGTSSDAYRGLTGRTDAGTVTLFATRKGGSGSTGGGELVKVVDANGYNASFSISPVLLATAGNQKAFRGVAFAPASVAVIAPSITTHPAGITIASGGVTTLSVVASGSAPLSYQWYQGLTGDTGTPVGTNAPTFTTPSLLAATSYWVRVSNTAGNADSNAALVSVSAPVQPCTTGYLPIHSVQGSGNASPLLGQVVTVRGVVVGDYEGVSPALRGFYLQSLAADFDADSATSEGVFAFEANNANSVSVGQVVQVTGSVAEFQNQTEIDVQSVEDCGTTSVAVPVDVTLPTPPAVSGVPYLERLEGMLVRFHQTLYVTEHFQLGQFGQIVMSAGGRLPQPTSLVPPGTQAQQVQAANDLNQIVVDDELQNQNPDPIRFGLGGSPLSALNTLRGGDSATDIVGVLTYTWAGNSASGNAYRVRPVNAQGGGVPNFQVGNPRPSAPPNVNGRLKVVGMNVLNYFLTLDNNQSICGPLGSKQQCRGAETAQELARQQAKLNAALVALDADIIGMAELENTQDGAGNDVNPLADIVARLNSTLGGTPYSYINTGIRGTDAIRVGIIYKNAVVTPSGSFLVDNNTVHNRPPLVQAFLEIASGERFSVVVNHFKSKGCSGATGLNADQGDGQGCFNQTRVQQAQALLSFLNGTVIPTVNDSDILLVGDFNAYAKEDPIRLLEEAGYTNLAYRYGGKSAYSYVFDGQWGYLDHALASASLLAQAKGAGDYHINADEPSVLDYNVLNGGTAIKSAAQIVSLYNADQFRISDHDPVVVGLNLRVMPQAQPDVVTAEAGTTLMVNGPGVLGNDAGGPLSVLGYTTPGHGTLSVNSDGSYVYTPAAGFTGTDSFSYTAGGGSVLGLLSTSVPPLATLGGVSITGGAFGSALTPVPGTMDRFYGLTDRGPNVDGPGGTKVEPIPTFTPAIGKFRFVGAQAVLEQTIPLRAADGTPYSGRVNSEASTGETITDLDGNILSPDLNGYDPEGLVALADGTFWISDEYGPFITHFDATGKAIGRLSPFDGTLPRELAKRFVNRGMEGLTITPDGTTLVGLMQSALAQTDLNGFDPKKLAPIRIVTYRLSDGLTREYLYLLDNPAITGTAASEITALSNTTFLVTERDGKFPPNAYKKLFRIDISGATDVGPLSTVPGAVYNGASGGLLLGGQSLELRVKNLDTAAASATLVGAGITPATKTLSVDIGAKLAEVDPQNRFFSHDKLEGVAVFNGGATLAVSNDSDFGIDGVVSNTPPFQLHAKTSPTTGAQDEGEFLIIDTIRSTATVSITVLDTVAPNTALLSTPVSPTDNSAATFTFQGSDSGSGVARLECSLDNSPFATCTSGVTYGPLAAGSHAFSVRAVDKAGNTDPTPAVFSWTIVVPGPTSVAGTISGKTGPTNSRVWTIALTNNGPAIANDLRLTGFTLTQTFGAACTPVVVAPASFPLTVGTLTAGTTASAAVTLNFTGCASTARFTVTIPFSANNGAVSGSIIRFNQFQ